MAEMLELGRRIYSITLAHMDISTPKDLAAAFTSAPTFPVHCLGAFPG